MRISSAGAEAAEARRKTTESTDYNLKYGPVTLRRSSALGIEGNDNVNLSEDDPQADFSFIRTPGKIREHYGDIVQLQPRRAVLVRVVVTIQHD